MSAPDDDLDPADFLPKSSRLRESSDDHEADALTERSITAAKKTQPMLRRASEQPPGGLRPTVRGLGTMGSDRPPPDELPTREQETRVRRPKHGTEMLGKGPVADPAPPPEARRMRTLPPEEVATKPDATRKMPRTRDVGGVPVLVPQTLAKMEAPKPPPGGAPLEEPTSRPKAKLFTQKLAPRHADEPEVGPEVLARAARAEDSERLRRSNVVLVAVASALAAVVLVLVFLRVRGAPAPAPNPVPSQTVRAKVPASAELTSPPSAPPPEPSAPSQLASSATSSASSAAAPVVRPRPPPGPKPGGPLVTD